MQETRKAEELAAFKRKIRVHSIADQDRTAGWVKEHHPDTFWIFSRSLFRGIWKEGDQSLVSPEWLEGGPNSRDGIGAKRCAVRCAFEVDDPAKYEWLLMRCRVTGTATVYLNGKRILRPGPSGDEYVETLLKPGTLKLIRRGRNVLAVELSGEPRSVRTFKEGYPTWQGFQFDCGMRALLRVLVR
ncbi:unnamed protein product [marine sediment metagenome]|uniref:Cellulose-binding Sde182 nucleoside hydrolase-like domain-containing protein n=1 Tax=marine sediment metagenome TaxID=412755 RepID=X0XVD7_9ZZZZ